MDIFYHPESVCLYLLGEEGFCDVPDVCCFLDDVGELIDVLLDDLNSYESGFYTSSNNAVFFMSKQDLCHDIHALQKLIDALVLSYGLELVSPTEEDEIVSVENLISVSEVKKLPEEEAAVTILETLTVSLVEDINKDFNIFIANLLQRPRTKKDKSSRCNSLQEMHYEKILCPLVGGSRPRGRRRGRRRGRYRGRKKNNDGVDGFDNPYRKPKTVTLGIDTDVMYHGLGNGLPRSYDTTVRALDNAFARTNAGALVMNWDYQASILNPVTGGASDIVGDFLRTGYGFYRVTGFDIDVSFSALEAFPVIIVLYPYGPFNTPTFTAPNTATLAQIRTVLNSRYCRVIPLGAITGGNTVKTFKKKYTMDKIIGETGIDWRSDNNFTSITTGSPANRMGLFVAVYSETAGVFTTGVGVRMSFNTHVEMFSPVIS